MAAFQSSVYIAKMAAYDIDKLVLFMVFYKIGSLDSWMKNTEILQLKDCFGIIHGTFQALGDLHSVGIVHNDIKPQNILLDEENGAIVPKLTDFGISNIVEQTLLKVTAFKVKNLRGLSISYASPERLNPKILTAAHMKQIVMVCKAADTYSMALVIVQLINRRHPWIYEETFTNGNTTMGKTTLQNPNQMALSLPGYLSVSTDSYQLHGKLAEGGYGAVFFGKLVKSNSVVVAKRMMSTGKESFIQEVSIMGLFVKHENFAQLVGYDDSQLTLLMIYYPLGSAVSW